MTESRSPLLRGGSFFLPGISPRSQNSQDAIPYPGRHEEGGGAAKLLRINPRAKDRRPHRSSPEGFPRHTIPPGEGLCSRS